MLSGSLGRRMSPAALGAALLLPHPSTAQQSSSFAEVAQVAALAGKNDDRFGSSVAVSGDTMVVGAPLEDIGFNVNQGAVYVFEKGPTGWASAVQVARLTASDGNARERFGTVVAIEGDLIAVGTPGARARWAQQGVVYVFEKPAAGWIHGTETARLVVIGGHPLDHFGRSVAVEGGVIYVGAPDAAIFGGDLIGGPLSAARTGAVYIFHRPAGGWVRPSGDVTRITPRQRVLKSQFGRSLAIEGDTLVVGAREQGRGVVFVFEEPATGWTSAIKETAILAPSDSGADDFGFSVGLSGDTVAVGAPRSSSKRGAAYVFQEPSEGWIDATEDARLTVAASTTDDELAAAIALEGDTVIAGSRRRVTSRGETGAAFVFDRPAGGWADMTETYVLTSSDGKDKDRFGCAIAMEDSAAVIGALQFSNRPNRGKAYVFEDGSPADPPARPPALDAPATRWWWPWRW